MILLFRQTVGKETLNPLAAVLSPLLTFRYCRPYKDSHLIKSSSKFNFSNLQEILDNNFISETWNGSWVSASNYVYRFVQ